MPIPVSCQCGKSFNAQDALAGKQVQCPSCKQPLQIPAAPAAPAATAASPLDGMSGLLAEEGMKQAEGKSCPECSADLKPEAVLCVECGFNLETGKKLQTMTAGGVRVGASETEKMLARAAQAIEETPDKHDDGYGTAGGAWMLFGVMLLGTSLGIVGLYAGFKWIDDAPNSNQRAGQAMIVVGGLFIALGIGWIVASFISTKVKAALFTWILIGIGTLMVTVGKVMESMDPPDTKKSERVVPERPSLARGQMHVGVASPSVRA